MGRVAGGLVLLIAAIVVASFCAAQFVAVWLFGTAIEPPVPKPAVIASTSSAPPTSGPNDRPPNTCAGPGEAMCIPR